EDKRLSRLGDNTVREVDVRIIAATNLDLEHATRERVFREDLYYRLNVFKIYLPPLRERRDDVPRLIEHFLRHHAAQQGLKEPPPISPEAMEALNARQWPGNVRELRNVIERAVLLADEIITLEHLAPEAPPVPQGTPGHPAPQAGTYAPSASSGPPATALSAPAAEGSIVLPPVDLDGVPLKDAKRLAGDAIERAYILAALKRTRW